MAASGPGVDHDLGDEVVVVGRDAVAVHDAGVDPDPGPAGMTQRRIRPGRGEVARRVLGRRRTSMAWPSGSAARSAAASAAPRAVARPPAGTARWTMSRPATSSRHPVLDLEPGVDLEEVERAIGRPQELRRRRIPQPAAVATRPPGRGGAAARRVRPGAGASSTSFWWRRWSEQSRSPMATIRPVASPSSWTSMWRAGRISRSRIDRSVAERGRASADPAARPPAGRAACDPAHPRPPPPAAALTSNGKPIRSASATIAATASGRSTGAGSSVPGRRRPRPTARRARLELVAEGLDRRRRRPDEDEPGVLDGAGERRPLGQEPVARMDRLGAGRRGRRRRSRRSAGSSRRGGGPIRTAASAMRTCCASASASL
jgi:hypothetical protein